MKKIFVVSWTLTTWATYAIKETGGVAELIKKDVEEKSFKTNPLTPVYG